MQGRSDDPTLIIKIKSMVNEEDPVEVEFACDSSGNHKAGISQCVDSKKRKFSSLNKAIPFIEECSYVYNLDELFMGVPEEKVPTSLQGIVCNALTCN